MDIISQFHNFLEESFNSLKKHLLDVKNILANAFK